jgi:hypothetical protein
MDGSGASLFIFRAGSVLQKRIKNNAYPFSVKFIEDLPVVWPSSAVALLFFPEHRGIPAALPRNLPFLVSGPLDCMEEAFQEGARDFLIAPLLSEELRLRVGRLVKPQKRLFTVEFSGVALKSPLGSVVLGYEDAELLEALVSCPGQALSRAVLRETVWPELPENSRVVDVSVARLRKKFRELGENRPVILTRRGFGYMVQNDT